MRDLSFAETVMLVKLSIYLTQGTRKWCVNSCVSRTWNFGCRPPLQQYQVYPATSPPDFLSSPPATAVNYINHKIFKQFSRLRTHLLWFVYVRPANQITITAAAFCQKIVDAPDLDRTRSYSPPSVTSPDVWEFAVVITSTCLHNVC
jgi:hypothetical protein